MKIWGVKNGGRLGWKNSIKGTIGMGEGERKAEENDFPLPSPSLLKRQSWQRAGNTTTLRPGRRTIHGNPMKLFCLLTRY